MPCEHCGAPLDYVPLSDYPNLCVLCNTEHMEAEE